jgi:hypothetical protein
MAIEGGPKPRLILAGLFATVALAAAACGGTSEEVAKPSTRVAGR